MNADMIRQLRDDLFGERSGVLRLISPEELRKEVPPGWYGIILTGQIDSDREKISIVLPGETFWDELAVSDLDPMRVLDEGEVYLVRLYKEGIRVCWAHVPWKALEEINEEMVAEIYSELEQAIHAAFVSGLVLGYVTGGGGDL